MPCAFENSRIFQFKGRDENISLTSTMKTSVVEVDGRRRRLENHSLIDVDHENLSLVENLSLLSLKCVCVCPLDTQTGRRPGRRPG